MASIAAWTDPEVNGPSAGWLGLKFTDPEDETGYQSWRVEHVRPFTQFAMYSATAAAVMAWFAVLAGALDESRTLALWLIPVEIALLILGAFATSSPRHNRWMIPVSSGVNVVGGALAVAMTASLQNPLATAACVTMAVYFGLTMFRLPPRVALASVAPYTVAAQVATVIWYVDGAVSRLELIISTFVLVTCLVTGTVVNLAMEWITRQSYADHVVIEGQQEALFEERTNMAKFLSPQVADAIHDQGLAATLGTRLLSLTAVSIDLRGFTHYTQVHGPARMAAVLRDYYEAVIETARDLGATVKDFAGDGALILVGAPLERPDHARAGLTLARRLQVSVGEVTRAYNSPEAPLGVGVGVASGECAVGAIGSLSQLEYTAVGTAVNLSSRLCDLAQDGQIVISPATAAAVSPLLHCRQDHVEVAGFADTVEVTIEDTLLLGEPVLLDE